MVDVRTPSIHKWNNVKRSTYPQAWFPCPTPDWSSPPTELVRGGVKPGHAAPRCPMRQIPRKPPEVAAPTRQVNKSEQAAVKVPRDGGGDLGAGVQQTRIPSKLPREPRERPLKGHPWKFGGEIDK